MPQQFDNPANVEVHRRTTAQEILRDFADTPLDAIITGVGTGGHITACAEVLKPVWPNLKVFAVEPALAPLLSGGKAGTAPDPGPRRQFHPEHPQYRDPRRNHRRRCRRSEGNGAPRGARGRAC